MCNFVSWIELEKAGEKKIYFLTGQQVFGEAPRAVAFREYCKSPYDYPGHGAIRWYYGLETREGLDRESEDFSSPANFPPEVVRAIKAGEMRGMGTPTGLFTAPAHAEYQRGRAAAYAEYQRVRAAADAEYQRVRAAAEAEYQRVRAAVFGDLFAVPENRAEAWR